MVNDVARQGTEARLKEPDTETHWRSWAKSISWRLTGIVTLGGLSYLITKNVKQTTIITVVFHTLQFVLYYYHERVWARIKWGKISHPLSHLPVRSDLTPDDHEAILNLLNERKCLAGQDYEI